jgi:hypothetical protein
MKMEGKRLMEMYIDGTSFPAANNRIPSKKNTRKLKPSGS